MAGADPADHFGKSLREVVKHPRKHIGRTTNWHKEMTSADCVPC